MTCCRMGYEVANPETTHPREKRGAYTFVCRVIWYLVPTEVQRLWGTRYSGTRVKGIYPAVPPCHARGGGCRYPEAHT